MRLLATGARGARWRRSEATPGASVDFIESAAATNTGIACCATRSVGRPMPHPVDPGDGRQPPGIGDPPIHLGWIPACKRRPSRPRRLGAKDACL